MRASAADARVMTALGNVDQSPDKLVAVRATLSPYPINMGRRVHGRPKHLLPKRPIQLWL
jgi:hypothetical protein